MIAKQGKKPAPSASGENNGDSLTSILDAAERTFGSHGFDGGSMREIAEQAGIAQSLLHYHYRNKASLYEATFARRAHIIREVRSERLNALLDAKAVPQIEEVLSVLFMPLDELLGVPKGKLRHYVQMLAAVTLSSDERSIAIVSKFYDRSAQDFIDAFRKVVPSLTSDQAVWAYLFAVGARLQAHSPSNRAERLGASATGVNPYVLLVDFVASGIRQIASSSPAAARTPR